MENDGIINFCNVFLQIPYEKQLELKDHKNFEIMVKLTKRLKPNSTSNGIITQLKGTLPSVSLCQQLLPLCLLPKSYHFLAASYHALQE